MTTKLGSGDYVYEERADWAQAKKVNDITFTLPPCHR
jgi:hypothetical protein